ncbi:MAG: transposase [Myxococcota bacterium]
MLPAALIEDIEDNIAALGARIDRLRQRMVVFARQDADLSAQIDLLCSVPGIGEAIAVEVLSELGWMPRDLTARQLVAQAGLDPRPKQSGQRDAPRHISKLGSKYLRGILHMAALTSVQHCSEVEAFHRVLTEQRHKKPLVAYVAVSRKLLHTIHGMLKTRTAFDPSRFYQPKKVPRVA